MPIQEQKRKIIWDDEPEEKKPIPVAEKVGGRKVVWDVTDEPKYEKLRTTTPEGYVPPTPERAEARTIGAWAKRIPGKLWNVMKVIPELGPMVADLAVNASEKIPRISEIRKSSDILEFPMRAGGAVAEEVVKPLAVGMGTGM
ncbi:unnamed protein product, partial [marine sediment metagenome]